MTDKPSEEAKLNAEKKQEADLKNPDNLTPKKWWKLAKSYIKNDHSNNSSYPLINSNGNTVCDDNEKAEIFNNFFLTHSNVDDSNVDLPDDTTMVNETLNNVALEST